MLAGAGCPADGAVARTGRDFVAEVLCPVPDERTLHAWNLARDLPVGGRHVLFGTGASAPGCWDMELGRKIPGTRARCVNLLRLSQHANCIHFIGGCPVGPLDIPVALRHIEGLFDVLTLTDKVPQAYSLGASQVEEATETGPLAGGWDQESFAARPHLFSNINPSAPPKHEALMLDELMRMARRGQGLVLLPFTLAGAAALVPLTGGRRARPARAAPPCPTASFAGSDPARVDQAFVSDRRSIETRPQGGWGLDRRTRPWGLDGPPVRSCRPAAARCLSRGARGLRDPAPGRGRIAARGLIASRRLLSLS